MEHVTLLKALEMRQTPLPAPLMRELEMVTHKLQYPMAEILAQVPGDNLSARAKKLGVSRQTMYVWLSERFRPTLKQAKRISRVTGVPVAHIVDNGFEAGHDRKRKAPKKAATVARRRKTVARKVARSNPKPNRKRKADALGGSTAA